MSFFMLIILLAIAGVILFVAVLKS